MCLFGYFLVWVVHHSSCWTSAHAVVLVGLFEVVCLVVVRKKMKTRQMTQMKVNLSCCCFELKLMIEVIEVIRMLNMLKRQTMMKKTTTSCDLKLTDLVVACGDDCWGLLRSGDG